MTLTDSQVWCAIIGATAGALSGLVSIMGHVAVLCIRELRRRPDNIPPPHYAPPPGTTSTLVTQTPPSKPAAPAVTPAKGTP